MSERQKVYRAFLNFDHRGATVWCQFGYVSQCGEWVAVGDTLHRKTADWFDTEAAAKASKADEVAQMGAKLINQAAELRGGLA